MPNVQVPIRSGTFTVPPNLPSRFGTLTISITGVGGVTITRPDGFVFFDGANTDATGRVSFALGGVQADLLQSGDWKVQANGTVVGQLTISQ